jgi:hypothetical protein
MSAGKSKGELTKDAKRLFILSKTSVKTISPAFDLRTLSLEPLWPFAMIDAFLIICEDFTAVDS